MDISFLSLYDKFQSRDDILYEYLAVMKQKHPNSYRNFVHFCVRASAIDETVIGKLISALDSL